MGNCFEASEDLPTFEQGEQLIRMLFSLSIISKRPQAINAALNDKAILFFLQALRQNVEDI
jgi:hypothetical protein